MKKKQGLQSALPRGAKKAGIAGPSTRMKSEEPGDLSSMGGALAHLDINHSRMSSETRGSAQGSLKKQTKYVNLQALIDREIIVDQML